MKIKRDPRQEAIKEVVSILENHEWLFHSHHGLVNCSIEYHLLADLVLDIGQQRREAIN